MSNIEEMFKKQLDRENLSKPIEKNSKNVNDVKKVNFDEILSQIPSDDEYQKQLEEKIKEMSGSSNHRVWKTSNGEDLPSTNLHTERLNDPFNNAPKVNISDLVSTEEDVRVVVEHVFCPKCGEELISVAPVMWNPFDLKKIVRTECPKCDFKAITNTAVPAVKFYNKNNELIKAFHE